jgi:hypothetical protein
VEQTVSQLGTVGDIKEGREELMDFTEGAFKLSKKRP